MAQIKNCGLLTLAPSQELPRERALLAELSGITPEEPGHGACVLTGMLNQPPSLQDPRTFAIIGAAYEVHRVLGTGFLEVFYKDALEIEFGERQIPFERESPCRVEYKGRQLSRSYHVDFVCFGEIVLEIKARSVTGPADHAQVLNYLASTQKRIGLLLNFGPAKLEHRRFIWEA